MASLRDVPLPEVERSPPELARKKVHSPGSTWLLLALACTPVQLPVNGFQVAVRPLQLFCHL